MSHDVVDISLGHKAHLVPMSTQLATIKQLYLGTYLIRKLDLNSKPKQLLVAIVRNVLGLDN